MSEEIKTLEDFKKHIRKTVGDVGMITATEKEAYGDVIPTTSFSLRNALGVGGFCKRKIYTIDGDLSSGKSTTGYDVIANCQKTYGDLCLLIDKEDSYTTEYGQLLGIDNERLIIVTPHTLEDMYSVLITSINSHLFGVILVDSVTSFAPEARYEDSVVMGLEARVNSDKMRLVADAVSKSNTCCILIQQTRQSIGGYGDSTVVSGGKAIPFYAHVRIRITRSKIDRELQQNTMRFTIIKNKLKKAFSVGTIIYKWGVGFDVTSETAELALELGVIKVEGRTYYLPEVEGKIVNKTKLVKFLESNPEYVSEVLQPKVSKILEDNQNLRLEENEQMLE